MEPRCSVRFDGARIIGSCRAKTDAKERGHDEINLWRSIGKPSNTLKYAYIEQERTRCSVRVLCRPDAGRRLISLPLPLKKIKKY
jgi:hypothetical protein